MPILQEIKFRIWLYRERRRLKRTGFECVRRFREGEIWIGSHVTVLELTKTPNQGESSCLKPP